MLPNTELPNNDMVDEVAVEAVEVEVEEGAAEVVHLAGDHRFKELCKINSFQVNRSTTNCGTTQASLAAPNTPCPLSQPQHEHQGPHVPPPPALHRRCVPPQPVLLPAFRSSPLADSPASAGAAARAPVVFAAEAGFMKTMVHEKCSNNNKSFKGDLGVQERTTVHNV